MESVLLVIHLFLAIAIIILVLLQRSEGGGLGIGGGGGGLGSFASARTTANALTRMTAICAAAFFTTSIILAIMAGGHTKANQGLLSALSAKDVKTEAPAAPAEASPVTITMPPQMPAEVKDAVENAGEANVAPAAETTTTDQPNEEKPEPAAPVAQ
ncbi:MAG: preprotein translocase subunit SecG [Alphaproteobacteria bacterium]|nr:preprotein translocase subunit SecG [Alphaproteobacteria bacterium]